MVRRNLSTKPMEPPYTPPWVEVAEWDGCVKGDKVIVKGTISTDFTYYTFLNAHVIDDEVIAVNVFFHSKGHSGFRSFLPERVRKPVVRKKRGAK